MKILLLGRGGQIGWELQRSLALLGEVVACDFDSPGDLKADFSDPESLAPLVRRLRPCAIVNAAAYTAVDKAESEPGLAHRINAAGPAVLAREAAAIGACLVHYSTDCVFDGSGSEPRAEDAPTAPLSVYGRTKLAAEELVRASGCRHLILRTSWVYAARGGNFVRTVLRLAAERDALRVVNDQIGAPTSAELLADMTALALPRLQADAALGGTFHCAAGGETSRHGYAQFVIEWARSRGLAIQVAPDMIAAIATTAYPTLAQRPLNSRLDTRKLQSTFNVTLPHWQQGVRRMLTEVLG
jgi:dTDP-4-dehydrorhamnose reductase